MTTFVRSYPSLPREQESLPRLLLVDDEPAVLDGLRRQLRRLYAVSVAVGAAQALEILENDGPFAVVVSDMRMPGMDGAAFLSEVRRRYPDTTRLLLTGQADTESAVSAVNDGQVFRFLIKPCTAEALQSSLADAVELHRLVTVEKDLLEQTLRASVQSLIDVLALAQPSTFSRAVRISQTVAQLAEALEVDQLWEAEISGMLAQVGAVTLPADVLEKLDQGLLLSAEERDMLDGVPATSARLIASIPRLEGVADAIAQQRTRYDGAGRGPGAPYGDDLPLIARILRVAVDFDLLRTHRIPPLTAIAHMRGDGGAYDPRVLETWHACHVVDGAPGDVPVVVTFDQLQPGMVLMEDVLSGAGTVLLGRGSVVTEALRDRLENHIRHSGISGRIVVGSRLRR